MVTINELNPISHLLGPSNHPILYSERHYKTKVPLNIKVTIAAKVIPFLDTKVIAAIPSVFGGFVGVGVGARLVGAEVESGTRRSKPPSSVVFPLTMLSL